MIGVTQKFCGQKEELKKLTVYLYSLIRKNPSIRESYYYRIIQVIIYLFKHYKKTVTFSNFICIECNEFVKLCV